MKNKNKIFWILSLGLIVFTATPNRLSAGDSEVVQVRGDVEVKEGETVDSVMAVTGSIEVNGVVRRDVVSFLGDITLGPKGRIEGDAITLGGEIIQKGSNQIQGEQVSLGFPLKDIEKLYFLAIPVVISVATVAFGLVTVFSGLGFIALIVLVLVLFEKQAKKVETQILTHPWRALGCGVLGFLATFPVLIFLSLTVVGIPLAFIGLVVIVAALVLGSVGVGLCVGTLVSKKLGWKLKSVWSGLLGTALLMVVSLIPFVGHLVQLCVLFFGLGAVIETRFKG